MEKVLTPRERKILLLRYGLDEYGRPLTLEEAGEILNITRERVRQIEKKALRKMKRHYGVETTKKEDPPFQLIKKKWKSLEISFFSYKIFLYLT